MIVLVFVTIAEIWGVPVAHGNPDYQPGREKVPDNWLWNERELEAVPRLFKSYRENWVRIAEDIKTETAWQVDGFAAYLTLG